MNGFDWKGEKIIFSLYALTKLRNSLSSILQLEWLSTSLARLSLLILESFLCRILKLSGFFFIFTVMDENVTMGEIITERIKHWEHLQPSNILFIFPQWRITFRNKSSCKINQQKVCSTVKLSNKSQKKVRWVSIKLSIYSLTRINLKYCIKKNQKNLKNWSTRMKFMLNLKLTVIIIECMRMKSQLTNVN